MNVLNFDPNTITPANDTQLEFRVDYICEENFSVSLELAPITTIASGLPATVITLDLKPGTTVSEAEVVGRLLNEMITGFTLGAVKRRA